MHRSQLSRNANKQAFILLQITQTHPGRKEFSRIKVGTVMSLLAEVAEVGLQRKAGEKEALLFTDRLIVVQQVVT